MKKLILILLFIPVFVFSQNKKEEKKAKKSANTWLLKIDNGQYLDSWDTAGKYLQNAIQADRWSSGLKASRAPLGKLIARKLNSSDYKVELPGAPDGKYYVLTFDVVYENKQSATETVSLLQGDDGIWRVVGFYIK
mgnify:CR=1 FL=1|tara:strand:+ start:123 stop:530 length:408 start_codon:yes stop_codon:yes gene_type:complete